MRLPTIRFFNAFGPARTAIDKDNDDRSTKLFFRRGRKSKLERSVPALPITVKALPTDDRPSTYRGIVVGQTRLTTQVDRRKVSADKVWS